MNDKYILYARKSTDVEDKQVLSIEAQLVELRAYALSENLQIVDELIEKKSAKMPGRPIFAELLKRIEHGEASGILSWHPDRLARNSIDGGQIIYLLDQTRLNSLKFPSFWFENTSQGKFMLSIAFGQSKYYVDNLSENTKRGLRQKVRRGEMPGRAPLGYINDVRDKTVGIDKRRAPFVVEAFELYAKGESRLQDIADFLLVKGVKTKGNKPLKKDQISKMLTNPFYYGHFRYAGEVFEGKHTPIVSKKLFDDVQKVIEQRKHKRTTNHNDPKPLCGLLHCGSCNMMITGENQTKRQKNGNVHHYTYYHCTKKRKSATRCLEPHIRQELLGEQLSEMLQAYAMPMACADKLHELIDKDVEIQQVRSQVQITDLQANIAQFSAKLQRLLDSYLDQDIDRETYVDKKAEIMSQKKSFDEKLSKLTLGRNLWLEPMKKWIETAVSICKIASSDNLEAKKLLCLEIFGSNLVLKNKKAHIRVLESQLSPQKNRWVLLRKTVTSQTKQALARPNLQFCPDLVRLLQTYSKHCTATKTLMDLRIQAECEHRLPEIGRRIPATAAQMRPEQVDELIRLYGEMKSVKGLARHLGAHHHTVRKHLIDRGVEIEQPRQMSADELALATHLYTDKQLTAAQIAPTIGFTASTIVKALNRAGVKMRPQVARG